MAAEQKAMYKLKQRDRIFYIVLQKYRQTPGAKLILLTALIMGGILGRVALQGIPSVEPLTALAIFTGYLLGPYAGFVAGATGYFGSNFLVFGGHGPWTIFQMAGAGLAGFIGGIFSKFGRKTRLKFIVATIIGITAYEAIVTVSTGFLISAFVSGAFLIYVLTSLPFSFVHLVSSIGFSLAFYEMEHRLSRYGTLLDRQIIGIAGKRPVFYFRQKGKDKILYKKSADDDNP